MRGWPGPRRVGDVTPLGRFGWRRRWTRVSTSRRPRLVKAMLSTAHAGVIADATSKLPAHVTADERRVIEAALVDKAAVMNPGDLRRAARRCLEAIATDKAVVDAHENTLLVDEEAAALARSELTMWDNPDGTLSGRFTVPHFAGAVLRKTIEAMTSPQARRARGSEGAERTGRVRPRRNGAPCGSRLRGVARAPTHRPTALQSRRHRGGHDRAGSPRQPLVASGIDTGERLSAGEARRIACNAGILPAVLNGKSVPLDLGSTSVVHRNPGDRAWPDPQNLRGRRLRKTLRLVRNSSSRPLGARRANGPRQGRTPVWIPPPTDPRQPLHPPTRTKRVDNLPPADLGQDVPLFFMRGSGFASGIAGA